MKNAIFLLNEELEKLFPEDQKQFEINWPKIMYGLMYATKVNSGARSGEIRALRWDCVLWEINALKIIKQIDSMNDLTDPKGGKICAVLLPQRTNDYIDILLLIWIMKI